MSESEFILYQTPDGQTQIQLKAHEGTIWLTQAEIATLFKTSTQAITQLLKSIYSDGEMTPEATCKECLQVRQEGKRQVKRQLKSYNLEMILTVGYRVRSARGIQFRQWATEHLSEYLVKGFVMDDERLKNPQQWDYFDELLARIREIRASEKRFYQKIRELFALSADYDKTDHNAQLFFADVQNKLLYAVTEKTAAEIVQDRADPNAANMALTHWSGLRVRKHDVIIAKNYLKENEIDHLNRLVVIFLEQAELRTKQRQQLTLEYWQQNIVRLLEFNEQSILTHKGNISAEAMKNRAHEKFETFDAHRRKAEAILADETDIRVLEELAKKTGKQE
ncbi:MAG: virulence RhuM family protein [Ectothiorhodospiraceae bacterium]|nr:virulence RhuM family protein [Ectothiorhodospiraceae bacterium]